MRWRLRQGLPTGVDDMRRLVLLVAAVLMLGMGLGLSAAESEAAAPRPAMVTVIQAVPGADVGVWVDERQVATNAEVGAVLGPFELAPGTHDVVFEGGDLTVESTLDVAAGDISDVVLHLPAEAGGDPVVHSYRRPDRRDRSGQGPRPAGPHRHGRSGRRQGRRRDGLHQHRQRRVRRRRRPAGTIEVALLPSGSTADPILGPLDVTLEARTLSMIYAYGNPRDGSMNVIAHTAELSPDGSVRPARIDTGSAGLVRRPVTTFTGAGPTALPARAACGAGRTAGLVVVRRRQVVGRGLPRVDE